MGYDREAFDEFSVKHGCVIISSQKQFSLPLRGETPYYIDYRRLQNASEFEELSRYINAFLRDNDIDPREYAFVGVPDGTTRTALYLSIAIGNGDMIQARKRPLEKETARKSDKHFVGEIEGKRVIAIEDSISRGEEAKKHLKTLREAGADVDKLLVFCNRSERTVAHMDSRDSPSAKEMLEGDLGIRVYSMTDVDTLIPNAVSAMGIDGNIKSAIRRWHEYWCAHEGTCGLLKAI